MPKPWSFPSCSRARPRSCFTWCPCWLLAYPLGQSLGWTTGLIAAVVVGGDSGLPAAYLAGGGCSQTDLSNRATGRPGADGCAVAGRLFEELGPEDTLKTRKKELAEKRNSEINRVRKQQAHAIGYAEISARRAGEAGHRAVQLASRARSRRPVSASSKRPSTRIAGSWSTRSKPSTARQPDAREPLQEDSGRDSRQVRRGVELAGNAMAGRHHWR